jgi:hypothetical protein
MACPISGVISFINAQVGAGCSLRLLLNTIPPQMVGVKHGIRGDAWFGSV